MSTDIWGDQQIELLTELWVSGSSARDIAQKMTVNGHLYTKNSVLGKVFRLGLSRSGERAKKIAEKGRQTAPKAIRAAKRKLTPPVCELPKRQRIRTRGSHPVRTPTASTHVLLTETRDHHCRAIIGYQDGQRGLAICCGKDTLWNRHDPSKRTSWCLYHFNLYTIESKKR